MSARVFLNLLNELRKSGKMRGLPTILSGFFRKQYLFYNKKGSVQSISIILNKSIVSLTEITHLLQNFNTNSLKIVFIDPFDFNFFLLNS